jgi:hypothetical protein
MFVNAALRCDADPDTDLTRSRTQIKAFFIRVIPWMLIPIWIRASDADPTRSGSTTLHKTRLLIPVVDIFLVKIYNRHAARLFKHVKAFLMKHSTYVIITN